MHGQAVRRNYLPGGNMYNICSQTIVARGNALQARLLFPFYLCLQGKYFRLRAFPLEKYPPFAGAAEEQCPVPFVSEPLYSFS